jgi:hypothetical protein
VNGPIRGEFAVAERTERIQLFTADGSVDPVIVGMDSVPRAGETIELRPGQLYVVEHVRWHVLPGSGALSAGVVTARILLRATEDPFAAR